MVSWTGCSSKSLSRLMLSPSRTKLALSWGSCDTPLPPSNWARAKEGWRGEGHKGGGGEEQLQCQKFHCHLKEGTKDQYHLVLQCQRGQG